MFAGRPREAGHTAAGAGDAVADTHVAAFHIFVHVSFVGCGGKGEPGH